MKKILLGLAVASLMAGAAQASTQVITSSSNELLQDPQFTEFRSNKGKSDFWRKEADNKNGKGDVGSSKDTAFDAEGSVRIRFRNATDDFSATPGVSQEVAGLKPNTDYTLSFYYNDKKGENSPSQLLAGVLGANGKTLSEKSIHVTDLSDSPKGAVKKSFRQASLSFNSGDNTSAVIYTRMRIIDTSGINMDGDIGKQTEVRLDEFALQAQ